MAITMAQAPTRTSNHNILTNRGVRLWTVQSLLAVVFLGAGVSKLFMSGEQLTEDTWLSAEFLRFIGVCEALGGLGLVLPGVVRVGRQLTSLAAWGLAVIMAGAVVLTAAAGDVGLAGIPLVTGLLCVYVATRRRAGSSETRFAGKFDYAAN